jgi:cytochrome P450
MTGNLTLDVLCETVFGSLVGAQRDPNGTISKRVTDFMNGTGGLSWIIFLPFWDKLPMGKVRRFLRGQEYLVRVCKEVIQTRKSNGTRVNDLLQSLIDANLSEEDTLAEALLFLIAGHETTAIALTWAIYAISQNPEVEKKLVAEIDKVLQGKPPTQGNIHSLEYIEMIVDETLRMYPPAAVTSRDNSQEVNILGHTFPPNTPFFLPIWAIHHNEKYWPEPEKFIPERFDKKNHINPAHYFPFGGGPRMCIGFRFSLTELKVALAMLYQKFTFEYPRQKHPEIGVDGFLKPIDLPIIAHLRQ